MLFKDAFGDLGFDCLMMHLEIWGLIGESYIYHCMFFHHARGASFLALTSDEATSPTARTKRAMWPSTARSISHLHTKIERQEQEQEEKKKERLERPYHTRASTDERNSVQIPLNEMFGYAADLRSNTQVGPFFLLPLFSASSHSLLFPICYCSPFFLFAFLFSLFFFSFFPFFSSFFLLFFFFPLGAGQGWVYDGVLSVSAGAALASGRAQQGVWKATLAAEQVTGMVNGSVLSLRY